MRYTPKHPDRAAARRRTSQRTTPNARSRPRRPRLTPPTARGTGDPVGLISRLTRRDHTLLQLLSEHRVLSTEQISRLLFPSLDRAQRRLLTLYRLAAIDRFRRPGDTAGTLTSWHYTLGPAGAAILAARRDSQPPHPATLAKRLTRLAIHPQLDHLLAVNDLMSTLAASARDHPGDAMPLWWGERHAAQACGHLVRPDALALWHHHPASDLLLLVEHDTGTETLARVADKLTAYHDLAAAGGPHLDDHPTPAGLVILFHLANLSREDHLRPLLESRHTPSADTGLALTVATSTTEFTDRLGPAAEVWLPLHTGQRRRLDQLTC